MYDPLREKTRIFGYSLIAFVAGLGMASGMGWTESGFAAPSLADPADIDPSVVAPAIDMSEAFVEIAEAVTPAVVRIEVRRPRTVLQGGLGEGIRGLPLPKWFNVPPGFGEPPAGEGDPQPRDRGVTISGGSGFIISDEGYILTNDHVVNGAEELTVHLSDGRTFQAEIVGTDPFTDVATLRIDADDLTSLALGSSEELRVGEWVMAVGNPGYQGAQTLDYTVTAGIVSAKGRGLELLAQEFGEEIRGYGIEDFIQTDAAVNPGNSGGPLVNLRGEVVGINSAIASTTGYYQGYSFAIPVDLARTVMADHVEFGRVRRPRIGVRIEPVDALVAEAMELPRIMGVLVQSVDADGPAQGLLEANDVILSVDGVPADRVGQLQSEVAKHRPGETLSLEIYRDGRPRTVEVVLAEAPLEPEPEVAPSPEPEPEPENQLGIGVSDLTDELAGQWGYAGAGGAIITSVRPDGPAARRGIQVGMKLLAIDDQPVTRKEDVGAFLDAVEPGETVRLRITVPNGNERTVVVRMPG